MICRYRSKGSRCDRENASLAASSSNFATLPITYEYTSNTIHSGGAVAGGHAGCTRGWSARIVETHPSAAATLGRNESFYVRIEYAADEPISLWARPYRDDNVVAEAMSNPSSKYTGFGEALGWFARTEPGDVDEVRIIAGGGKPYREWELARQSLQLTWTAASRSALPSAAWVGELQAAAEARNREEAQRRASEPVSAGEVAVFSGFMLLILALLLGGIGIPLWSVWKWRGGWRIAAAVPAAVVGFVVLRILIDTARDPDLAQSLAVRNPHLRHGSARDDRCAQNGAPTNGRRI